MSALPWSKIDNEWILAQREERLLRPAQPCSEVEAMAELAALYSTGRLAKIQKAPLARSFGWTRWLLMRRVEVWLSSGSLPWLDDSPTATAQTPSWWPTAHVEESREVTDEDRQQPDSNRTPSAHSRARSSSEKEREREKERDSCPGKTLDDDETSAKVSAFWSVLEEVRMRLHPSTRALSPRKVPTKGSKRYGEIRRCIREASAQKWTTGELRTAAEWMYESANTRAEGARNTGEPLRTLTRTAFPEYVGLALQGHGMPGAPGSKAADTSAEDAAAEGAYLAGRITLADLPDRLRAKYEPTEAPTTPALRVLDGTHGV